MTNYLATLRSWWLQPDHFDWLSSYLETQRLRGLTRFLMVAVILLLGIAPLLMHWSPSGPADGLPTVLSAAVAVITVGLALLWALRWPSRRQSKAFSIVAAASIAAACFLDQDPAAGMIGGTCFAAIAGYVAFFHTSPYLAGVVALALTTTAINAGRMAAAGDPANAASNFMVVLVGVLAVPSSVQVLVRLLGSDAAESDIDALTGALNRRGFYRGAHDLVAGAQETGATVGVMLVDLDGFKRVNDTRGHAAGDRLLTAVSDILRRQCASDDSVATRFGGEEFVVAGLLDGDAIVELAERVRLAVAALPDAITVSIGTVATTVTGELGDDEVRILLDRLVATADAAMYAAKRAGGNRVNHDIRMVRPR